MTVTLTTAGADSGPFDIYSDLDGYLSAFETGVSKASLLAGYSSALVPNGTNNIRIKSIGVCVNYIDIPLTTTTTTSTSSTTTSSTTTIVYYSYSVSSLSNSNATTACGYAYDITLYSAYSTVEDINSFTASLYTDTALTTVFVGNSEYRHILGPDAIAKAIRITASGTITGIIVSC